MVETTIKSEILALAVDAANSNHADIHIDGNTYIMGAFNQQDFKEWETVGVTATKEKRVALEHLAHWKSLKYCDLIIIQKGNDIIKYTRMASGRWVDKKG